jgi:ribosomal protein S26
MHFNYKALHISPIPRRLATYRLTRTELYFMPTKQQIFGETWPYWGNSGDVCHLYHQYYYNTRKHCTEASRRLHLSARTATNWLAHGSEHDIMQTIHTARLYRVGRVRSVALKLKCWRCRIFATIINIRMPNEMKRRFRIKIVVLISLLSL